MQWAEKPKQGNNKISLQLRKTRQQWRAKTKEKCTMPRIQAAIRAQDIMSGNTVRWEGSWLGFNHWSIMRM